MNRKKSQFDARSASYLALGCVGALAVAAPANAQDDGQATQLEGVVVTDTVVDEGYKAEEIRSNKMTAPIIDTPRTINVVTEEVINDSASFSFEDALRNVPGITLGAGEGGVASADIPFIRGSDATSDIYVDGARDVGSQTREIFATERIEVFKGPNSAFGGRGGAGGTINIVSKVAREGAFMSGTATAGTDDLYRGTVDINQPLNDAIAVRIAAMYHDADTPGRDAVHEEKWGVSPSITFGLGTDTQASLSYYHFESDGIPDYGLPYKFDAGGDRYVPDDDELDYDNFYGLLDRDFQKTRTDSATFQFNHDFGTGWSLYSTLRYSDTKMDYVVTNPDDSKGNVPSGLVWRGDKSRYSTNESFVGNAGASGIFELAGMTHSISFGGEFTASDTDRTNYTVYLADGTPNGGIRGATPPVPGASDCDAGDIADYYCTPLGNPDPKDPWLGYVTRNGGGTRTKAESIGFYAFDTITIVPELLLNLGLRWEQFDVSVPTSNVDNKTDSWSYQAGLVYKPVEALSLYASYANATTPPGTDVGEGSDSISGSSQYYEPQETENYEVGVKYNAFDGGLLVGLAAFRSDKSDYRNEDPVAGSTVVPTEARTQGIELSLAGNIGPVSLSGGYVYIDSEFLKNDATLRGNPVVKGNRLPNTARHNLSLWSEVALTERFSLGGGAYYVGKRYADPTNNIAVPDYWRFDAMASYRVNDNIAIQANVKNVADERYVAKPRNPHFFVPGQGRQGILTVSFTY